MARGKALDGPVSDRPAHEPECRMADGRRHPAHLPIAAFADRHAQPTVGHTLTHADRGIARPQDRWRNDLHLGPAGDTILELNAGHQTAQAFLVGLAFDLHEIGFRHLETWIGYTCLQPAVVAQQKQPLAVEIEAASGVNARYLNEIG